MKITSLILVMTASLLAGCSFAPIGENTFDCNRKSNPSEYCRSFKSLEKSTNGNLPESRFDKEFRMSDYDKAVGIAPNDDSTSQKGKAVPVAGLLPHNMIERSDSASDIDALNGRPVRNTPVIMRTWIKHYTDEDDTYIGDLVAYKEVQGSKWNGSESFRTLGGNASGSVYPHRSTNSANSTSVESSTTSAPNARQDSASFSQPPAGDDETGMQPPASGASMPQ